MKIKLNKKHKYYDYVGTKPIAVSKEECFMFKCFKPHNWKYTNTLGKCVTNFKCNTREHMGCPDTKVVDRGYNKGVSSEKKIKKEMINE